MEKELVEVDIHLITVRPSFREQPGDLATLENSIRHLGLLFPVIINQDNILISGSRRLQACRNIGMEKIEALRVNIEPNSLTALDIQCNENLCRKPLTHRELEKEISAKKKLIAKQSSRGQSGTLARVLSKVFGRD
jgi:ParB family chromosome partitioning protein